MVFTSAGSSGLHPLPVGSIMRARMTSAPVTLPVRNSWSYARFRHLQGVPGGDEGGYSLNRLRALDALIDRLAVAGGSGRTGEVSRAGGDSEQLDQLIASHRQELQSVLGSEPAGGYGAALGGMADTGALFNSLA